MLSLTRYEKYVLVFLLLTGLLGAGFLHHNKVSAGAKGPVVCDEGYAQSPAILNINTATEKELTTLKGIGPVLASRIVEYRRKRGYFTQREDLKKVKGIGPSKFEYIKDKIEVE